MDDSLAREAPASAALSIGKTEFIALMAALMALNAMAIDIMLPGLQQIGSALGVADENSRQLIISAYVLGLGGAQLFYGPITDRFGRRTPLLIGLVIYVATGFACAFAPSFAAMLVLRLLQGIGAAATRVVAISAIRDVYGGRRMAEVMSMVMMVFMIIPVVAPSLGQVAMLFDDWPSIFLLMGFMSLIITVWTLLRLPETLAPEMKRSLSLGSIMEGFRLVLTNRVALCYTLASTAIFGALFGFINSAQQIYVEIYDMGTLFPLMFAIGAGLMAVSSFTSARLVGRYGMRRLSHAALLGFVAVSGIWLIMALFDYEPFWLFFILFSLAMFQFGWVAPNFNSIAMEPLGRVAGTAAAVQGFITTLGGGVLGALIGLSFDGTLVPLAAGYFISGGVGLILVLIGERGQLFRQVSAPV